MLLLPRKYPICRQHKTADFTENSVAMNYTFEVLHKDTELTTSAVYHLGRKSKVPSDD